MVKRAFPAGCQLVDGWGARLRRSARCGGGGRQGRACGTAAQEPEASLPLGLGEREQDCSLTRGACVIRSPQAAGGLP